MAAAAGRAQAVAGGAGQGKGREEGNTERTTCDKPGGGAAAV
jgi:hypothetical protein